MSSAIPSKASPVGVRNESIAAARARVERVLHVAGQVPRDRPDAARVQRVDEAAELPGLDDVARARCSSPSRPRPC